MKKYIILFFALALSSIAESRQEITREEFVKTTFAWGADAGAGIDLSANDMSDVNFSLYMGVKRGWLNFLGGGVGADIATSNGCRSYDFFGAIHTNFADRPTLLFWPLRVGVSLNYLEHNHQQTGLYGTTGLGVNLARGKRYVSYMLIGYTFRQRRPIIGEFTHNFKDLHYATVKIGLSF